MAAIVLPPGKLASRTLDSPEASSPCDRLPSIFQSLAPSSVNTRLASTVAMKLP